jgi:release factor glutamine methyltransferase
MQVSMNVATVLAWGERRLTPDARVDRAGNPALDAAVLLASVLGVQRSRLISHPDMALAKDAVRRYESLIARRASGEPLAYLTGVKEFWSLPLIVNPAVLIPRPESELLVERALALWRAPEARAADLGTGSGALALALARERPHWRVVATDVSAAALEVARANAARLGLPQVEFRQGEWLAPLRDERFDLLLSNPPYVAADDPAVTSRELAYEPRAALTPGGDALSALRTLARGARAHLQPAGWLLLEHGAEQGEQVRRELVLAGFRHVRSHTDLGGHERMTEGQHGQI